MGKKNKMKNMRINMPAENKDVVDITGEEAPEVELHEFDVWWVLRQSKIPPHHMKEVIKADMKARGLSDKESMETFDKALIEYGIKL